MRTRILLPAALLGVALLVLPHATSAPGKNPADADSVRKLIEQLGSDRFAERQKAAALDKIGEPALAALRKACDSTDAETRKRATELVAKIDARVQSAGVLKPTLVHLVYKDVPLSEAVADFKKKSGYSIVLLDPEGKLKDTKITLDTGKVAFWDALEQFCAKAGLTDAGQGVGGINRAVPGGPAIPVPVPVRPAPPRPAQAPGAAPAQAPLPPGPKAMPAIALRPALAIVRPIGVGSNDQITLQPGKPVRPVDASTSVRIRPADKKRYMISDAEIALVLEAAAEPKVRWQRVTGVTVSTAVDDNDQKLTLLETPAAPPGPAVRPGLRPAIMILPSRFTGMGQTQMVTVRLKPGEKASKSLKTLAGVITGDMLTPARPVLTADNLMKAAGKTFKGPGGGEIKVLTAEKKADGSYECRFEFEMPEKVVAETAVAVTTTVAPAPPVPNPAGGPARPRVVRPHLRRYAVNGLTLRDAKGNVLNAAISINLLNGGAAGKKILYVATYRPADKDAPAPAQLVFTGRRVVSVSIPFSLKGVALK